MAFIGRQFTLQTLDPRSRFRASVGAYIQPLKPSHDEEGGIEGCFLARSLSDLTRYLSHPTFYFPLTVSSTLPLNTLYGNVCSPLQTYSVLTQCLPQTWIPSRQKFKAALRVIYIIALLQALDNLMIDR